MRLETPTPESASTQEDSFEAKLTELLAETEKQATSHHDRIPTTKGRGSSWQNQGWQRRA